jgi:hypothetical protein
VGRPFATHPYLPPRLCPLRTIDEGAVGDGGSVGVSRDTLERRFSIGSFWARSKNESRRRVETSATAWADTLLWRRVSLLRVAAISAATSNRLIRKDTATTVISSEPKWRAQVVVMVRERGGNSVPAVFQFGKPSCIIHSRPHREGNGSSCRRSGVLGQPS